MLLAYCYKCVEPIYDKYYRLDRFDGAPVCPRCAEGTLAQIDEEMKWAKEWEALLTKISGSPDMAYPEGQLEQDLAEARAKLADLEKQATAHRDPAYGVVGVSKDS